MMLRDRNLPLHRSSVGVGVGVLRSTTPLGFREARATKPPLVTR